MASLTAKTLFVHNLPRDATTEQFTDVFSEIGPIKRCHIVIDKDSGKSTGKGYVTFAFDNDAEKALKSSVKLGNNILKLKYTTSKEHSAIPKIKRDNKNRKEQRKLKQTKKRRVIIRNLSFNATEEKLKEWISKYGNVEEINIPKDDGGKVRGFAFVTFDNMKTAVKTIKELNAKEFLQRKVAIDFALPKEKFNSIKEESQEIKKQEEDEEGSEVDEEDSEDAGPDDETLSIKSDSENNDESDEDGEESDDDEDEEQEQEQRHTVNKKKLNKPRTESNDVSEGKTIFIRNLSFETMDDQLEEIMETFGELEYCLINVDSESGHSKGTAFVKFKHKESADQCIERSNSEDNSIFFVDGRQLQISLAVSKKDLGNIQSSQKGKIKDKRNLYLAKEGLIYPKSPAAKDVSQADLAKRYNLEQRKRKLLNNVLYFVSTTRLNVHNLPPEVDDKALRNIFVKAVNDKSAVITEAKVMRRVIKSENKLGASKGFGFVTFKEPKHALIALRRLNNNPDIFSKHKRPIVEFSIENTIAINKKKHRNKKKCEKNTQTVNRCVDLEEEDFPYMGVKAKPLKESEKVQVPKMNRKMFEVRKDLKERAKVVKKEQKVAKEETKRKKMRKEKAINRKQNKPVAPKKEIKEMDDFEAEYVKKRKNTFLENVPQKKTKLMKKAKWYESTD